MFLVFCIIQASYFFNFIGFCNILILITTHLVITGNKARTNIRILTIF